MATDEKHPDLFDWSSAGPVVGTQQVAPRSTRPIETGELDDAELLRMLESDEHLASSARSRLIREISRRRLEAAVPLLLAEVRRWSGFDATREVPVVADAIGALESMAGPAVPLELERILDRGAYSSATWEAAWGLFRKTDHRPAAHHLRQAMTGDRIGSRISAALIAGRWGMIGLEGALSAMADDAGDPAEEYAAIALGQLGVADVKARLEKMWVSKRFPVDATEALIDALARVGDDQTALLLGRAAAARDDETALLVIRALSDLETPNARKWLRRLSQDGTPVVRCSAQIELDLTRSTHSNDPPTD